MHNRIAFGILAGLIAALLYSVLMTGAPMALVMFYLAPLPLAAATLALGWPTGVLAALVGAASVGFGLGLSGAAFFLMTSAAPTVWLARLTMLSRPGEGRSAPADGGGGDERRTEWYPPGRVVQWAAGIASALAVAALLLLGPDTDTFRASLRDLAGSLIGAQSGIGEGLAAEEDLDRLVELLSVAVLPATSAIWLLVALFNLWLGARLLRAAGRLGRPWPDFSRIEFSNWTAFVLLAALVLSFTPGFIGAVAPAVAAAFLGAYLLLGLAVLHCMLAGAPGRRLLLALTYGLIVLQIWPALIVALLGLGEPIFKLRARALAHPVRPGPNDK